LLVIFGIGDAAKIAIIAIGIFFLVLFNTTQGVKRLISLGYFNIIFIYKIPYRTKISKIIFQGALPEILNGIKMGLGYGLVMVIAGEFTISKNGIGFFMWNAWDQFRILDLYCGLVVISLLGYIIFIFLERIQNRLKGFQSDIADNLQ